MNPKLINPLDSDEYANAAPTIGTLMAAHYSSPDKHRDDLYEADTQFFSMEPDRRTYLRPAFPLEWDLNEDAQRPTLWCQVMRLSPGFHQIIPVWRGKAFWSGRDVDSDSGVGIICYACAMREGINLSEWIGYMQDCRVRNADELRLSAKKQVIH
jgi:hypothetical protein